MSKTKELDEMRADMAKDFGKILDGMPEEEGKAYKEALYESIRNNLKEEGVELTPETLNAVIVGIRVFNNYTKHNGEIMAKLLSLAMITMYEEMKV